MEKAQFAQQVEKLQRDLKRSENEKENLSMKLKVAEKTAKENKYVPYDAVNDSRRKRKSTPRSIRPSRLARRNSRTKTANFRPP
jgi:hypothetical protein